MLSLLSLFTVILFNPVIVSSLNDEGKALLSFKQSITQDPQGSLTNWNTSNETPCSWLGITCKQQKVISITIPNKNLSGYLSSSLGSLSHLRHLNLRNNKLVGTLPLQLFNVHSLQSLVLYGNSLSGLLPFGVENLIYLQTLDLSFNLFNGSLPQSLVECKKMKNLVLSHNNFSGFLPNEFGKRLVLLEKLDLSHNHFDGFINDDLGDLLNLQGTFDLSHNRFSGSIPLSFGNLPEKVYIDLSYNNLTGPIPQNGSLVNRGPTAFVGNPGLCGPPLKNLCSHSSRGISPSSFPYFPQNGETVAKVGQKGLTKASVIAIIVSDLIGICVIGFLFSYCYSKVRSCYKNKDRNGYNFGKRGKMGNECLCFRKEESDNLSESLEQYDLVALDADVAFDLDELLKASAFVLGKSGIGIVYKVVLENGFTLAVRRLGEGGSQRFNEFRGEVEAIGKLRHRNIVMLRAYYWSVDEKLLIYDFVPNGNLDNAIHGKLGVVKFKPLSWSTRLEIMKGVTRGLVYLHEYSPKKYVHGDLKPSNILLGHNMEPKISDFGLSRLANIAGGSSTIRSNSNPTVYDEPQLRQASFGSKYRAPEAVKVAKPSQKWDVYSFGIILLEMITGKSLLVRVGPLEIDLVRWMEMCIEEKRPLCDVLDHCLVEEGDNEEEIMGVLKIAMACTQSSPDRRPLMRHVLGALDQLELPSD